MSDSLAISPDWNAFYCYLLVLLLGLIVAYSRVARLFQNYPGAWGTVNIWLLLLAYTAIPLVLFWFLDWTNAIRDTSVFAAILVAVGYRQLLTGRMSGIQLPGEASRVWQPFEAWANWLGDRIGDRVRLNQARYTEQIIGSIEADPQKLDQLKHLALLRAINPQQVQAGFDALSTPDAAALWGQDGVLDKQIRFLYQSLRTLPDSDLLMRKARIIGWFQYLWYAKEWRSKSRAWIVVAAAAAVLLVKGPSLFSQEHLSRYYLWRLEKPNTSAVDRLRSTKEYSQLLVASPTREFERLGHALQYDVLPVETAERLIGLFVEFQGASISGIPSSLIPSLRTTDPDTRARIQATLSDIAASQKICVPVALARWKPSKNDSATQIDEYVKQWLAAWRNGPTAAPCQ